MISKRFVAKNGLDNNSQTITNVANPALAQDAATKSYVDARATNVNTGDETTATIKTKLGIATLSGVNTGDQTDVTGSAGNAKRINFSDRRALVQTPNYFGAGADWSFMANATDGLSDGGTYHGVMQYQPYNDASGGGSYQLGFTDNNNLWIRGSSGGHTAWAAWKKIIDTTSLAAFGYTTNVGTVTGVTATGPVVSSGGAAPVISMAAATAGVNGYMTTTYAAKLDGIAANATANGTVTGSGTTSGTNTGDQTLAGLGGAALAGATFTGNIASTVATGTAPLTVASSTLVSNLNVDYLDGQHGAFYLDATNQNAGTLPDARLSANVPLKSAVNVFSAANTFVPTVIFNGGIKHTTSDGTILDNIALKSYSSVPNGYIKLVTPIRTAHNQMFSITISGYDYNSGKSIDFTVVGYAYSGTDTLLNVGLSNRSSFSKHVRIALEDRGAGYRVMVITLGADTTAGTSNEAWYYQKFSATIKGWAGNAVSWQSTDFSWVTETSLAAGFLQTSNLNNQWLDSQTGSINTAGTVVAGAFSGPLTGNASSATALQNARAINGVSFNGTSDITIADSTKVPLTGATMTGALNATDLGVVNALPTTGKGISLYGGANVGMPIYGISFAGTPTFGTHGAVTGDWATYLTMDGATTRGWIFRHATANVASVSSTGVFTGSSFVGPTAVSGTNTTQMATTAFVQAATNGRLIKSVAGGANVVLTATEVGYARMAFNGALTANISVVVPNAESRWDVANLTTGAFTLTVKTAAGTGVVITQGFRTSLSCDAVNVYETFTDFKDIALTGVSTAITAGAGTNTTQIATTAFVQAEQTADLATVAPLMNGTAAVGVSTKKSREDHVHASDTSRAPVANPVFTGMQTAPYILINRTAFPASGISWYSAAYNAWCEYMGQAGVAGQGPKGNLTPVAGTIVTGWARRSFIENTTGFGWTFESASSGATSGAIMAEISSVNGNAKFLGNVTAAGFVGNVTATDVSLTGLIRTTSNSATGVTSNVFNTLKTVIGGMQFNNGAGASAVNANQAAITFQGTNANEAQAGIYVTNDAATGTAMGFATTQNYAVGPQIALTISNVGTVNFVRGRPTFSGNTILDTANIGTVAPSLAGAGAAGTWGISITGNASNVTGTVAIANGGTGSTNAAAARIALGAAPETSPGLLGVPTAPTALPGTNTTQLATTEFVQAAVATAGGITTVSPSLTLTPAWQDVGISGAQLASGSYMVQVYVDDYSAGGQQYSTFYTGVMSWSAAGTNSTTFSEILLHCAGQAQNGNAIFLRTMQSISGGFLKLQISSLATNSGAATYAMKFKLLM